MAASVEDIRDCDEGFLVGNGGMLEVPGNSELENGLLHASTSRSFAAGQCASQSRSQALLIKSLCHNNHGTSLITHPLMSDGHQSNQ